MAISDAQFAAFLATDTQRALLAEVKYAYESGGVPAEGIVYVANLCDYRTQPTDTPPNIPYRDAIVSTPKFSRLLSVAALGGGQPVYSIGDFVLNNADGSLDFLLTLVIDGREVKFLLGDPSWARADFRTVLVAVTERVVANETSVTLKLRDKRLLLDREIKGKALGGLGPNATKYLPLLWGFVENIDLMPFTYDDVTLEYGVISNFGAGTLGTSDVRDDGLSLRSPPVLWTSGNTSCNAGTDVVTHVAHGLVVNDVVFFNDTFLVTPDYSAINIRRPFAHAGPGAQLWVKTVPTADTVTFSATKGGATLDFTAAAWNPDNAGADLNMRRQRWYDSIRTNGRIQLSSKSAGQVTADVYSLEKISGADGDWFVDTELPFNLAFALMYGYGNIRQADLDLASMGAADTALDAKVLTGYASLWIPQRMNLLAVLDQWIDIFFGWYGANNLGVITCGLVDLSGLAAATPTRTLGVNDVMDGISCENLPATLSVANLNYQLNRTVQGAGLSALVTDANRTRFSSPFGAVQKSTAPLGTAYSINKPLYHKTMVEGAPRDVPLDARIPASDVVKLIYNYANEVVNDRRPYLQVINGTCRLDKFAWGLGDVVQVTYPRYGLDAGKNFRLMGIDVDLLNETVALTLLTYTPPDVTTASHY